MIVERPAALDVHKAQRDRVRARSLAGDGGREPHLAEFLPPRCGGCWVARLAGRAPGQSGGDGGHLGVYWKPVWHILEDDFELMLVYACHVKQVPGRKTDMSDAAWLCQLAEAGLLRALVVPPRPIRQLRQLTRYRKTQIAERQREAQRLHKALEDSNVKLDCVATTCWAPPGARCSTRSVTARPTRGPRRPGQGGLRRKIPALQEALEGRFDELHAPLIGAILAHLDFLDEQIDRLSEAIEAPLAPFDPAVELLCTIPGVGRRAAPTSSPRSAPT